MSVSNAGKLVELDRNGSVKIVLMNQTTVIPWNEKRYLGTESLGGCSVVAIGSPYAGIMSHTQASEIFLEEGMREIEAIFTAWNQGELQWFPLGATKCWVVFPYHLRKNKREHDASKLASIKDRLLNLGLNPVIVYYDARDKRKFPGQGSCYLKGDPSGEKLAKFYYEDKEVH